jgi:hypothetical protein
MRRIAEALGVKDPLTVYELCIAIPGERHDPA